MPSTSWSPGELYADLIMSGFEFWPLPGQESFANQFHREVGGGAANTACALARLGSRTAVFGIVGSDGDWLLQQLAGHAVDTSHITRDPTEPTAFTVAITTPEDRTFFTYSGANRGFSGRSLVPPPKIACHPPATFTWLFLQPRLQPKLLASLRARGCTVSLDVGWHEDWLRDPRVRDLLPLLDLFFPNESEAAALTGESEPAAMLRWFSAAGLPMAVVKLGPAGACLLHEGEVLTVPPPPVVAPNIVIDTTGAGDCFNAGFLQAWMQGDPPETCLRAGNICGALSTQAYGGVAGMPGPERFHQLLKAYP